VPAIDGQAMISAEYDLTERDVIWARLWFLRRNKGLVALGVLVVVGVGGFIIWSLLSGTDLWSLLPFLLLLAFWIVFMPIATVQGSKRFYRTLLESERHTQMRFGADHFEQQDGESSGTHSWRIVQLASENQEAFYFLHRSSQIRIIPKRAFSEAADVEAFRALLRKALAERAHLLG